jgi:hypothetical protein
MKGKSVKNRALAMAMLLGAFAEAHCHSAIAQGSVGGPAKQSTIGGPKMQKSSVMPANSGGIIPSPPSNPRCPANTCVAKKTKK